LSTELYYRKVSNEYEADIEEEAAHEGSVQLHRVDVHESEHCSNDKVAFDSAEDEMQAEDGECSRPKEWEGSVKINQHLVQERMQRHISEEIQN
jgi:hypothetical protein